MPLDHYVSQVHLRNFYAGGEQQRLVCVKKDDLKKFYARSEDVCRRSGGSTNDFLVEPRSIENFLKLVEPRYNAALEQIRQQKLDADTVYVIAGFVAYLKTCSPTAMRIGKPPIAANLQSAAEIVDAQGLLPPVPEVFGNRSFSELLADGTLQFNVNEKYPQAIGISTIEEYLMIFAKAMWDIMFVAPDGGGFLTSDFPVAPGPSYNRRIVSWTVPLAPDIAIRIHPKRREPGSTPDASFPDFRARFRKLGHSEMCEVNQQTVRAAETMVFCKMDADWLLPFVSKNRHFRVECAVSQIPWTSVGKMIIATQRIMPFDRQKLR